jgi:hypothetical protein
LLLEYSFQTKEGALVLMRFKPAEDLLRLVQYFQSGKKARVAWLVKVWGYLLLVRRRFIAISMVRVYFKVSC